MNPFFSIPTVLETPGHTTESICFATRGRLQDSSREKLLALPVRGAHCFIKICGNIAIA